MLASTAAVKTAIKESSDRLLTGSAVSISLLEGVLTGSSLDVLFEDVLSLLGISLGNK